MAKKNEDKKDGKKYDYREIKRTIGDKRQSFYGKTKREAEQKYEDAKAAYIEQQITKQYEESNILFETWADKWLETYKDQSVRDITFQHTYQVPTKTHLIPYFKNKKLRDIRASDIKKFYNSMSKKSFSVQDKCKLCLRSIYKTAVAEGLVNNNPTTDIMISKSSERIAELTTESTKESVNYEQQGKSLSLQRRIQTVFL